MLQQQAAVSTVNMRGPLLELPTVRYGVNPKSKCDKIMGSVHIHAVPCEMAASSLHLGIGGIKPVVLVGTPPHSSDFKEAICS